MKLLTALAVLGLSTSSALADRVGFFGEFIATAVTQVCTNEGFLVGDSFHGSFMPANVGDNGPDTNMALYGGHNAFSMRLANSTLDASSPYTAIYINSYGKYTDILSGTVAATSVSPAPSATVSFVNIKMKISNFDATPGCTMALEGSVVRRR